MNKEPIQFLPTPVPPPAWARINKRHKRVRRWNWCFPQLLSSFWNSPIQLKIEEREWLVDASIENTDQWKHVWFELTHTARIRPRTHRIKLERRWKDKESSQCFDIPYPCVIVGPWQAHFWSCLGQACLVPSNSGGHTPFVPTFAIVSALIMPWKIPGFSAL